MHIVGILVLILIVFIIAFISIWLWFFQNEQFFFEKLYKLGIEAFNSADYVKAKGYLKKLNLLTSSYKDTKLKLCICYFKLKKYEKAEEGLQHVIKSSPKNFDALLTLAQTLTKLGKNEEAEVNYTNALKENEQSIECNKGLGLLKYAAKDFQTALTYFEKSKELTEAKEIIDSETEFYIIRCLDELCDYESDEQALDLLNKYQEVEKRGFNLKGFNVALAKVYAKIGEIEKAEIYCKKAISEEPENAANYKLLSVIQLIKKEYSSAKTTITTGLKLQPQDNEIQDILSYAVCYQVENCPLQRCRQKYFEVINKFIN